MRLNPLTIAAGWELEFIVKREEEKKMTESIELKQVRTLAHDALKLKNTFAKAFEIVNAMTAGDLTCTRSYRELEKVHEKEAEAYNNVLGLFGEGPETTNDFYENFVESEKKRFESA